MYTLLTYICVFTMLGYISLLIDMVYRLSTVVEHFRSVKDKQSL